MTDRTAHKRRAAAMSAGYTWFVRAAKIALPLAALVIVGVVVARLSAPPAQTVAEDIPREDKTTPGQIELTGAQYEGVDEQGRPYTLIAKQASRDPAAPDRVLMDELQADITLEDGTWIAVRAQQGVYDTAAARLSLSGGVRVFHDTGYEMAMQDLAIDLKTRAAQTANAVKAQGPLGAVSAAGLEVRRAGDLVVFAGPATITFHDIGGRG